jgi:hypothetical protein
MATTTKPWPKNAEYARTESIEAARKVQALCTQARLHIDAGNKWAAQAAVSRVETLAVCIERDLSLVKGSNNG